MREIALPALRAQPLLVSEPAQAKAHRDVMQRAGGKIALKMKSIRSIWLTGLLLAGVASLGNMGCHYDRDTAGRPDAEKGDGLPGSTVATKEGTGDSHVGSGRGQVGTDAPPRSTATDQPNSSGEKGDATGGRPDLR